MRTGRTAFWQIKCRGEPPPVFTWWHPAHGELSDCPDYTVRTDEYQGGSITTMVVHHAKKEDNGTYQLQAENRCDTQIHREPSPPPNISLVTRNGKEKIDLDLIVLDSQDHECDFYAHGNKQCSCQHSYTGSVQPDTSGPWSRI